LIILINLEGFPLSNNSPGLFVDGLKQLGVEPKVALLEQFLCYRQELLDWNTRMNLTAIIDPEAVLLKHFLDSLSVLEVYDKTDARLLDIGSALVFLAWSLRLCAHNGRLCS
jgi:16S rRNA (guanine527-N7)-methyltransferase